MAQVMNTARTRRAGVMVPLFSVPSSRSWGIGEIGDVAPVAEWLASAGQRVLQLLPINELPPHETSPYSAMSAMAIDPQFITLAQVEDFAAVGGEDSLDTAQRAELARVRAAPAVDYRGVRALKQMALRRAYRHFADTQSFFGTLASSGAPLSAALLPSGARPVSGMPRAQAFRNYTVAQSWWLDDYALFRALHARYDEGPWTEWPEPLKFRDARALAAARIDLADEIAYRQYLQWIADDQWSAARRDAARARAGPVTLFGDLPFMVALDSADVWARQDEFRLDASVGVPPDAFSETGQDWKLPAYNWDVFAQRNFEWLRHRARRNADLFGGYRVDHLVGYYRTYFRPLDGGAAQFSPSDQDAQTVQGERVLEVFRQAGAEIVAEDLGTVPDFVRESLARLQVPGCKVMRWERAWHTPEQPFIDPASYPRLAMATSGTHDTEPMTVWWSQAPKEERAAVLAIPSIARGVGDEARALALDTPDLPVAVREAMLRSLLDSAADLVIFPFQDLFGLSARINQPALVDDVNWTCRLPWLSDRLTGASDTVATAEKLREWTAAALRDGVPHG
jgi:4-alpha-glucanotransferase